MKQEIKNEIIYTNKSNSTEKMNLSLPKENLGNFVDEAKKRNIYIRTLNVFVAPLRGRYERHYRESKAHLILDIVFVLLILLLIFLNIYLFNKNFPVENIEIKITKAKVEGEQNANQEQNKNSALEIADTKLILTSEVIYKTTEGEQIGVGPYPPVVDETTSVWVETKILTDAHPVKNLDFRAELAEKINWTGKTAVSVGNNLIFDEKNNLVIWKLDNLLTNQPAELNFEVEFTPTESDLNKKIELIKNVSASGIDWITGKVVENFGREVETEKVGDL